MAGKAVASAFVTIIPSMKGFQKELQGELAGEMSKAGDVAGDSLGSSMVSKAKSFIAPLVATFSAFAAVNFFKGAIDAASDLSESQNAIKVSFGDAAKAIEDLGATSAKRLGLSTADFNGIAVQFSAFASTIAGQGGDVAGVIDKLSQRGADFASVMNIEVSDALALFQSGLAGETEPLRKYGIDLSAAAVEAYAAANGIGENGRQLTEAEKVQARYGALLQQTNKTQGDFANTSDGLANQQRILNAEWTNAQTQLGNALLPAMTGVATFANDVLIPAFKGILDGISVAWTWIRDNSTWIVPTTIFMGGLAGAIALAGFQAKLAAAGGLIPYFTALFNGSAIMKIVTAAQVLWNAVLAANPIGLVITLVAGLIAALVYFFTQTELGRTIWEGFVHALGDAWNWLWTNVLQPVFDFISAAFKFLYENVILPIIKGIVIYIAIWGAIFTWLYENMVKPAFEAIGKVFAWLWENIAKPFIDRFIAGFHVWGDIFTWLYENIIKPVFDGIGTAFNWVWQNAIKPVVDFIVGAIHAVGDAVSTVFGAIAGVVRGAFDGLIGLIRGPVNAVIDFINGAISGINRIKIDVPDWARGLFGGAGKIGFNIPSIPKLAKGGFVDRPTTALIGEAGPEVVTPLKDFERMMGLDNGGGKTVNYYAAPNQSIDSEQALFTALKRAKVLAAW